MTRRILQVNNLVRPRNAHTLLATAFWASVLVTGVLGDVVERKSQHGPVQILAQLEPAQSAIGDPVTLTLRATAEKDVELLMPDFGEALDRFGTMSLAEVLAPGAWASYLGSLAETSEMVRNAHGGVLFPAFLQVSVPGALALLFVPQPLALAAGLGLLGVVAWRWRKPAWEPGTAPWDRELASAMTLGWLASPHLLLYDLGLLLLPGWIARARLGEHEGRPFGGRRFYALTLLALVAAALWIPLFSVWLWDTLGELDRPRVIPQLVTVVLVAWALALGRRAAIH